MSTVAIPMPKPAGGRPPFGPPSSTTFASNPDDNGEPVYKRVLDSVQQVLNACVHAAPSEAPTLLRIIAQRRAMVERELGMLRMFDSKPMPPAIIGNLYSMDFLTTEDGHVERLYVQLLDGLEVSERLMLGLIDLPTQIEEQNG